MSGLGGVVAPGYEPVLAAFRENFAKRDETGASVVVYVGGEKVVDLHGGVRDRTARAPWDDQTLQILFSATKGLVATCFLVLRDRVGFDLDAPVASVWSGFGAAGKEGITIAQILDHTAGLVAIDRPLSLDDLEGWSTDRSPGRVLDALESQAPVWEPGTSQGYHAISYGLFAGELFKRLAGETVGSFLRREVAGPLGADVWLGLPASQERRVATLYPNGPAAFFRSILPAVVAGSSVEGRIYRRFLDPRSLTRRAFANPAALGVRGVRNFDTARVRAMELPWASGVGSADGLARVYAALASGGLVSPGAVASVAARRSWAWDRVLCKPIGFSLGFVKDEPHLFSPNPHTFGHPGAGGTLGFADPDAGIGFGYTMNRMDHRLRSPRALALAHALYTSPGLRRASR
ncbi:MAG: beta-lactamase family protein [Alphaproteobacteria bacterium]|nr:beta-lactamase family protein [Alphaproteobacteria bacterium]